MLTLLQRAPCERPLMFNSDKLRVYHAIEGPGIGAAHAHDEVQIAVPIRGAFHATMETDFRSREPQSVYSGSLLLTASRQPHAINMDKETELTVLWLPSSLLDRTAFEIANTAGFKNFQSGRTQDPLLHHVSLSILAALRAAPSISRLYIDSAVNLLASHLLLMPRSEDNPSGLALPVLGRLSPQTFRKVTDYIRENLGGDISLADLAEVAGVSESRFGLLFRETTGQTPYQFVISQRIERAKGLLAGDKLSIGEIALQTGFCDQSQFTRQFKKRAGLLPTEYANLIRY